MRATVGSSGVGSTFSRSRATCISIVRVETPRGSNPQTLERISSRDTARAEFTELRQATMEEMAGILDAGQYAQFETFAAELLDGCCCAHRIAGVKARVCLGPPECLGRAGLDCVTRERDSPRR